MHKPTFNQENLNKIKAFNPFAKYFVYFKLPGKKELPMVVNKGAFLKRSIKEQQRHLMDEYKYTMQQLQDYETYDLRKKK